MVLVFNDLNITTIQGVIKKDWVQTNIDPGAEFQLLKTYGMHLTKIAGHDPQDRYPYFDYRALLQQNGYHAQTDFNCFGWIETLPAQYEIYCRSEVAAGIMQLLVANGLTAGIVKQWVCDYVATFKMVPVLENRTEAFIKLVNEDCDCVQTDLDFELDEQDCVIKNGVKMWALDINYTLRGNGYGNVPKNVLIESSKNLELPDGECNAHRPLREHPYSVYTVYFPTNRAKFSIFDYAPWAQRPMVQQVFEYNLPEMVVARC